MSNYKDTVSRDDLELIKEGRIVFLQNLELRFFTEIPKHK